MKKINLALIVSLLNINIFSQTFLKEGTWRGIFQSKNGDIPFLFEVNGHTAADAGIYLINGSERMPVSVSQKNDSVFIAIDIYNVLLSGKTDCTHFTGTFKKTYPGAPAPVPFIAEAGNKQRFEGFDKPPSKMLGGTWDVVFVSSQDTTKNVGVFSQKGNYLTGSVLTSSGDYRYFEGSASGDHFALSAFSGNSPYLLKGKFTGNDKFVGEFITLYGKTLVHGTRNDHAALPDPYSLTHLKKGYETIDFTFPDLNGKPVSLKDTKYKNKVVIVTIFGTWCPNCMDETKFLAPWYRKNKDRGIEIIALAFERKDDFAYAKTALSRYKKQFGVDYDVLFGGQISAASKALPALNAVLSFPTMLFIDRNGKVVKIHTGYNGPATGKYYDDFIREFNQITDDLIGR